MHVKKQCPNICATVDVLFVSFNKRSSLCIVSKPLKLTPAGYEVDCCTGRYKQDLTDMLNSCLTINISSNTVYLNNKLSKRITLFPKGSKSGILFTNKTIYYKTLLWGASEYFLGSASRPQRIIKCQIKNIMKWLCHDNKKIRGRRLLFSRL